MPIYQYRCPCGAVRESFNRVSERRTNAPICHGPMEIELTPVMGYVQRDCHYMCPVTRKPVTSNAQRREIMAANGLMDANDFKPKVAFEKEEKALQQRTDLAKTLVSPLPEKEMRKFLPPLPG